MRAFYYAGPSNLFLENRVAPGWDFYAVSGNGSLYFWGNNPKDDSVTVAPKEYAKGQWSQGGSGWHHVCALPVGGGKPKVINILKVFIYSWTKLSETIAILV